VLTEKLTFNSADILPAEQRFQHWREHMTKAHAPMDLYSAHERDFRSELRVLELGAVAVWPASYQALIFDRHPRLIRQSDPDTCHISLVVSGTAEATWAKSTAHYGRHDLHTTVSSRPLRVRAEPVTAGGLVRSVGVEVPRAAIPLAHRQVDKVVGQRLSGREGVGALLAQFLTQLSRRDAAYRASDGPRLELVLIDLLTAVFAHASDAVNEQPPEHRGRVLRLRILAFIQQNLADPELSPSTVAEAHHISVRYLHRLFEDETETVVQRIRRLRLAGAQHDLVDPELASIPIHDIATRWGFRHHAVFTRAFRDAFGMSPSDHRGMRRGSTLRAVEG
jgi:AraC-like DNA-binding protein